MYKLYCIFTGNILWFSRRISHVVDHNTNPNSNPSPNPTITLTLTLHCDQIRPGRPLRALQVFIHWVMKFSESAILFNVFFVYFLLCILIMFLLPMLRWILNAVFSTPLWYDCFTWPLTRAIFEPNETLKLILDLSTRITALRTVFVGLIGKVTTHTASCCALSAWQLCSDPEDELAAPISDDRRWHSWRSLLYYTASRKTVQN